MQMLVLVIFQNNLFVFHRVEIWHRNVSIPALVFLTPLQNNPLS